MRKTLFLYSGEGTSHLESSFKLIQHSSLWSAIQSILKSKLNLNLEDIWEHHIGRHTCPHSPLLTLVTQICLSDLWIHWGYKPHVVMGHSTGELAASYQAGFYTLEEVLLLAAKIGDAASNLTGCMLHGFLGEQEIRQLTVNVSSKNFTDQSNTHVTLSGYEDELGAFEQDHKTFIKMKPPHPWHHKDYNKFSGPLNHIHSNKSSEVEFVSGITGGFEQRLSENYWADWLTRPVDFIRSMQSIHERYGEHNLDIIEIGFHPVLDRCCDIFKTFTYVPSMFRGEDEIPWILNQRRKLDPDVFAEALSDAVSIFRPRLDFDESLAYQGLTSIKFVELSGLIQRFFPSLSPQDFYRYKTIRQLIQGFGIDRNRDVSERLTPRKNEVVICGMSCTFPSSVENPSQFWEALILKEDQITRNPGRGEFEAGFLNDDISRFDHSYFKISNAEASTMDPQQILALELTELLWKDAGLDPSAMDRKRIGVYLGVWNQEYTGDNRSVYFPTGTNPSIIASRISYHYDLRGPSWVTNTACSSSLVAVHYAAKDIEDGRVDFAIAGGVNMILGTKFTDIMKNSGFLSKDNRCKTFDNAADGYVRAEGGGLILLGNKHLAAQYYGELIGSAINQNGGRSQVITAPHPEAQEELIMDACQDAGIDPADIAYVECHGTGTKIGDPIEITALQNTIARNRKTPCYLGSVKSNVGHLESAAGIAGIIKSLLILNHGSIPPNLHFVTPNQYIDFESFNLKVVSQQTDLSKQAIIGISSFGFGGANAHIIIKGADEPHRKKIQTIESPFDKKRASPLQAELTPDKTDEPVADNEATGHRQTDDVAAFVMQLFLNLTDAQTIDPQTELFEQGLDSMSAAELINLLETEYAIDLDPDLLFDFPLMDQFVQAVEDKRRESDKAGDKISRSDVAEKVKHLFTYLTSIESIDPDIELTEQGLNSLSVTELISQLESEYGLSIDPDIIFDYPLFDQLVSKLYSML
ncbi:MAG: hypothetical protein KKD44_19125 [Proteobacteria bacterium]|nr:hypothetical protein [Pseudomonadota bacterium]